MTRILWAVNFICIGAFSTAFVWTGFAIGKPDFQSRMDLTNFLLLPCLGFIAFRLLRRREEGSRD